MKRICIFLFLAFLPLFSWGQGISVQAPKTVLQGESFNVTFTVSDNASDFKGPSFSGFKLRSGPNQAYQSGYSNINGKISSSVQVSFSYTLTADREGVFTIGPASCTSGGRRLSSESFTVKVEKPTPAQLQQRQQQQQIQQQRRAAMDPFGFFDIDPSDFFGPDPWGQPQSQTPPKVDESSLFLRASVDKTNPWQGEEVTVSYKLYTQTLNLSVSKEKQPSHKGFWAEDLTPKNGRTKQYEEVVDGRRYQVVELRREALFPQRSGALTTDPLELTVQVPVRQGFYAYMVEHSMRTKPLTLNVKALPTPPERFSNAVGTFTVGGGLSQDSVRMGDAISYRLTVSGHGNLMLMTPPTPEFPASFEVMEQGTDPKLNLGDGGVSGSRPFEWALVPQEAGTYTIPAYEFIYFDPTTGAYKTLTVEAQTLTVVGDGEGAAGGSLGKTDGKQGGERGWTRYVLYGLSGLALLFIVSAIVRWTIKRYHSREVDPVAQRKRHALRVAQRRLKKAASYLSKGEPEPFYQEIYRALWGCLSDKYGIPTSQLSRETVATCMAEKQIPEEKQESILELLNEVDMARFAPGSPETQMQHVYQQALNVISEI